MIPDEMRCAMVRRLWEDSIFATTQWADAETIARQSAIPRGEEGQAQDLLHDMSADATCPVRHMGSGMFALERDEGTVRAYLRDHCLREDDLPWDLR